MILLKCKEITIVPLCKKAMPTENVYFHEAVATNALCHGIVTHRSSPGGYARLGSAAAVYTHWRIGPTTIYDLPCSNIVADAATDELCSSECRDIMRIDKPHPIRVSGTFTAYCNSWLTSSSFSGCGIIRTSTAFIWYNRDCIVGPVPSHYTCVVWKAD